MTTAPTAVTKSESRMRTNAKCGNSLVSVFTKCYQNMKTYIQLLILYLFLLSLDSKHIKQFTLHLIIELFEMHFQKALLFCCIQQMHWIISRGELRLVHTMNEYEKKHTNMENSVWKILNKDRNQTHF